MIYLFDNYALDTCRGELQCAGVPIKIERQVLHVLVYLVQHRHRTVSKTELLEQLWPGVFVSDWALSRCIALARKALGESGRHQQRIKTLHGSGYRFIAAVQEHDPDAAWLEGQTPSFPPSVSQWHTPAAAVELPSHLLKALPSAPDRPDGHLLAAERKQVTVFCAIVANAPALAEQLGPEAIYRLLQTFFALALPELQQCQGTVAQFLSDGFIALFGAPTAYEDHARQAVQAALGLQRELQQRRAELDDLPVAGFRVRFGIHTGVAVVGKLSRDVSTSYTAVGSTTHLAVQLAQHAEPGTILISDTTARTVRSEIRLETLGAIQLTEQAPPLLAFRVLGVGLPRTSMATFGTHVLSQFVGRRRELAVLHDALAQVTAGHGQVIGIMGEAGMGKSRLLYEFVRHLPGTHTCVLQGQCRAYGGTMPYLPWRDILRQYCGIVEADEPDVVVDKVRSVLNSMGLDPAESTPYLLLFLGLQAGAEQLVDHSAEAIKGRTLTLLCQILRCWSQNQPCLLILEDLQWIDRLSKELCARLVESLASVPLLLLLTYRPGYQSPWMAHSAVTQLALHPLSRHQGLTVIRSVHGSVPVANAVLQTILAKAVGNPFFLEELTLAIMDNTAALAAVPDTIQGVLMARIDQLPEAPKRLLLTAAVLGPEFPQRLLAAMWQDTVALAPLLQELQRREFLYERPGSDEPGYAFKHPLTQEVAYGCLIQTHRQTLHAAAGRALEALYAERLEEVCDRLSYHYTRTTEAAKAVRYLVRFAEQATRVYAHAEAAQALHTALEHTGFLHAAERDRCRLDVVLRLAQAYSFLGRFGESLELLLQHQPRLERLQELALAGPYYFRLGRTYSLLGDQGHAAQHTRLALDAARRCGDEATMGKAYYELAREMFLSGPPQHGLEYGQQAVTLLERTGEQWWLGMACWILGGIYAFLGAFTSALEILARAQAIGNVLEDTHIQSYATFTTGWIEATRGNAQAGMEICQRGLALAQDPVNTAHAVGVLGYAYLEQEEASQAIPLLEQAIQSWRRFRLQPMQAWMTTLLAEAQRLRGHLESARRLAYEGLTLASHNDFQFAIGLAQRALGRIAQADDTFPEATTHLTAALQTFTAIQARFECGRTHLDLAALAHAQGRPEAARVHLRAAHTLFRTLQVPMYVQRTRKYASAYGISLPVQRRDRQ
jgi:class 3 adenylate cyclase/DNA-binding winged helix-turn-helix (wHTH) protein/tetratricopeptide (TPR) repeat protein